MAVTHLDLDLSRLSFTDTGQRYVEASAGSLVSTTKTGRFMFTGSFGTKTVYIYNRGIQAIDQPVHNTSGLTYYGGVDYAPWRWVDFSITAGQDIEPNQLRGAAELMHFVRMNANFHLL